MGRIRRSSIPGRKSLWIALAAIPVLTLQLQARAGIADLSNNAQQKLDPVAQSFVAHEEAPAAQMYLPDPSSIGKSAVTESTLPEITIPQLPADVTTISATSKDGANAIPLPPAVQSGLTGLAAVGLALGFRRLRRVLR